MKKKDKSQGAFPWSSPSRTYFGMSKLEYFTAKALEGLCANSSLPGTPQEVIVREAVKIAKATLKELKKEEE